MPCPVAKTRVELMLLCRGRPKTYQLCCVPAMRQQELKPARHRPFQVALNSWGTYSRKLLQQHAPSTLVMKLAAGCRAARRCRHCRMATILTPSAGLMGASGPG